MLLMQVSMFNNCYLLNNIPDISKWNTSNLIEIQFMFYNCQSLSKMPDISKWNSTNISNIEDLFSGCLSLESLPNISKWKNHNIKKINFVSSDESTSISKLSMPNNTSSFINSRNNNFNSMNSNLEFREDTLFNSNRDFAS